MFLLVVLQQYPSVLPQPQQGQPAPAVASLCSAPTLLPVDAAPWPTQGTPLTGAITLAAATLCLLMPCFCSVVPDAPGPASPGGSVVPGRHRWRCMQPRLCPFCWKTFSNSFNLKQHVVNVHTVGQGLQCHLCHKTVKNKWYLRKHHVTAHGAPLKRGKHASGNNNSLVLQHYGQQDAALEYQDGAPHEHGHYGVDNMHLQDEYSDGRTASAMMAGDYCDRSMAGSAEYGDGSSTFECGGSGYVVAHTHLQRHHKRSSSSSSSSSAAAAPPSACSPNASTPRGAAGGALPLSSCLSSHSPPPTRSSPPSGADHSSVASVAVRSYHRHSNQRAASPGLSLHPLPSHSHQLA